eukprot:COSAG01_NODE_483_length_16412_cov_17.605162_8_plen_44_part_00
MIAQIELLMDDVFGALIDAVAAPAAIITSDHELLLKEPAMARA